MKKLFSLVTISALVMASASAFAAESQGQRSTVKFTGKIEENTCVLGNASEQTVDLGVVEASVLSSPSSTSYPTSFTISLEQCKSANASITFRGTPESDEVLRTTGGASGVGIQILDLANNSNPLKIDGSAPSAIKAVGGGYPDEFTFAARYIALGNNVTAGEASATAQFTVNYQ